MVRHSALPAAFVLLLLGYFLVQSVSFTVLKSGADIDTTELMMYNQFWSLGYWGSQPPLYNWLTHLAADVFGTSILVYSAAKFLLLFAAFAFLFLAARELGLSIAAAVAATLGVFAIPEISWEAQRALSHSAAVNAFCALSLYSFVRLRNAGRLVDYAFFGLAAAAAVLSKYNGFLFVAALVLSAIGLRGFSRIVLDKRFFMSLLIFGATIAPHALWALQNPEIVFHRQIKFGISDGAITADERLTALLSWAKAIILTTIIVVVATAVAYFVDRLRGRNWTLRFTDTGKLLVLLVLIYELVLLVLMVAYGATRMENRWLQPVLLVLPLTVLSLFACPSTRDADGGGTENPGLIRTFSVMGLVIMAVTLVALPVSEGVMSRAKGNETHFAYDKLLGELETTTSGPVGTVVSTESDIFGNILLYDPDIRFYNDKLVRAGHEIALPAVLIWSGHGDLPRHLVKIARTMGLPETEGEVFRSSMPINGNERTVDYSYMVRQKPAG
ncbi:ArnT family glycosyltransferase [Hoeflea sp.]|uniref:ArnT family glycosyltransferase n=1 Tax=Hoeflea sp. TaxID=1940281 RepID=UPI003B02496B